MGSVSIDIVGKPVSAVIVPAGYLMVIQRGGAEIGVGIGERDSSGIWTACISAGNLPGT